MNKSMEYMAFELPVVAFDLRETRVSVADAGIYVVPNDVHEYARAIVELIDDEPKRVLLGKLGRTRVEQELAWNHQKEAYLRVYQQVLRRDASQPRLVSSTGPSFICPSPGRHANCRRRGRGLPAAYLVLLTSAAAPPSSSWVDHRESVAAVQWISCVSGWLNGTCTATRRPWLNRRGDRGHRRSHRAGRRERAAAPGEDAGRTRRPVTTVAGIALDLEHYDPARIRHSRVSARRVHEIAGQLLGQTRAHRDHASRPGRRHQRGCPGARPDHGPARVRRSPGQ